MRIPKPMIQQLGLCDEVELQVREGALGIAPLRAPRAGWAEAAAEASKALLDPGASTHFNDARRRT